MWKKQISQNYFGSNNNLYINSLGKSKGLNITDGGSGI